jgi:hypothetical protein
VSREAFGGMKGVFVWNSLLLAMKLENIIVSAQTVCPFGVLEMEIAKVIKLHNLLGQLHKSAMLKVLHLEAEKATLSKKLIGLKFNMEYLN